MFIDRFSAGLDDLTKKQQADPDQVIAVLRKIKRFSIFEATANRTIARTMTNLVQSGRVVLDETTDYPWSGIVSIDGVSVCEGKEDE